MRIAAPASTGKAKVVTWRGAVRSEGNCSTVKLLLLSLMLGGNTSMPMRRHSAISRPIFSVSCRSIVNSAAMYSTG